MIEQARTVIAAACIGEAMHYWWRGMHFKTRLLLVERAGLSSDKANWIWSNLGKDWQVKIKQAAAAIQKEAEQIKQEVAA